MYDSVSTCAGSTLVTCDSEVTTHDTYASAQTTIDSPKQHCNRLLRAGPTLFACISQSLVHDTYGSTWMHAGNTLVTGDSEATDYDMYASAQRSIESSKQQRNRLSHACPNLLSVNSKLLDHNKYSSALTRASTTLMTGDSEATAHDKYASAQRFTFTDSQLNDEHSESSKSTIQSNKSHLKSISDSSGSVYLPGIDSDSDTESAIEVNSNSDSTFNSSSLNFPQLKSTPAAESNTTYNILPSYDVDPYMFIAFEISDP
eukprot:scaffold51711_cov66-Attheya_sp.AAC.1